MMNSDGPSNINIPNNNNNNNNNGNSSINPAYIPCSTHPYNLLLQLLKQETTLNSKQALFGSEFEQFIKNTVEATEIRNEIRINILGGQNAGKTLFVQRLKGFSAPNANAIAFHQLAANSSNVTSPPGSPSTNKKSVSVNGMQVFAHNEITFYVWDTPGKCKFLLLLYLFQST